MRRCVIFLDGTLCRYNMETKNCLFVTCSHTAPHPLSSVSRAVYAQSTHGARAVYARYTRSIRAVPGDRASDSEVYRLLDYWVTRLAGRLYCGTSNIVYSGHQLYIKCIKAMSTYVGKIKQFQRTSGPKSIRRPLR